MFTHLAFVSGVLCGSAVEAVGDRLVLLHHVQDEAGLLLVLHLLPPLLALHQEVLFVPLTALQLLLAGGVGRDLHAVQLESGARVERTSISS